MTARANYKTQSPEPFKEYGESDNLVEQGATEEKVSDLVAIRVSQLNECAFCLNTFCLRNTSSLFLDRFSRKSFRATSVNADSPN